jgi:3-oxoacyl-[acyl-carrier-protein] synthase I
LNALDISHFTVTNALGTGNEATWSALQARRSGLTPCDFETVAIDTYIGRVVDRELAPVTGALAEFDCRNNRLAARALEADGFGDAVRALAALVGRARVGVFLGTSTSGILSTELAYRERDAAGALPPDFRYAGTQNNYSLAGFVSAYFGLLGPAFVVSSACSSSAKVFGNAARMIEAGFCDAAIVGGVDSLCLTTLYGFRSLGLTSAQPCRPYDAERDGISIAEAAGFALLQRAGASTSAAEVQLLGVGESSDAYHMSSPHPEGRGALKAMRAALAAGSLSPEQIGYINLHGTATKTNDAAEGAAVASLFGTRVPASSTKGYTGHTLGAAGITEIVITALALTRGVLPGSANTNAVDPEISIDYLLAHRNQEIRFAMSNSFGFGGSNCSVVLGRRS